MGSNEEHVTFSEQETLEIARSFARRLRRGDVVALWGELGTGKTLFVKGVCEQLGARRHVSSPSFVILNRYEGSDPQGRELLVYHLDLYRVKSVGEIVELGFEEFTYGEGITLVEWADQLGDLLPARRYDVRLHYGSADRERMISIDQMTPRTAPPAKSMGSSSL